MKLSAMKLNEIFGKVFCLHLGLMNGTYKCFKEEKREVKRTGCLTYKQITKM